MGHIHPVWNDDPLFLIDPDSRTITKESSTGKNQLMQYDHNSEVFRFKIPATIEGHPVSNCDIRQIHYINTGTGTSVSNRETKPGIYEIPEFTSDIDDTNYLYFDWLISQNATQLVGDLKFQIKLGCTNPYAPGVIDYMWGSQVYSAVEILPGINNTEIVVTEYTDILEQWKAEIAQSLADMDAKIDSVENGYTPQKGIDYWTEEDKADIIAEVTGVDDTLSLSGVAADSKTVGDAVTGIRTALDYTPSRNLYNSQYSETETVDGLTVTYTNGYINNYEIEPATGKVIVTSDTTKNHRVTYKIPVIEGKTIYGYSTSNQTAIIAGYAYFYDKNENFISYSTVNSGTGAVVPKGARWVRISSAPSLRTGWIGNIYATLTYDSTVGVPYSAYHEPKYGMSKEILGYICDLASHEKIKDSINNESVTVESFHSAINYLWDYISKLHAPTVLDSGICGENLTWTLYSDGLLKISGTGRSYDYCKGILQGKSREEIEQHCIDNNVPEYGFQDGKIYDDANAQYVAPWYKYRDEVSFTEYGGTYCTKASYDKENPNGWKYNRIEIDEGITYLGDWFLYRVSGATELIIPEGVTELGDWAIRYSPTLKYIYLPDSLTTIGYRGCSRNEVATTIRLGSNVTSIGNWGLANEKVKHLNITAQNLGAHVCEANKELESVTLENVIDIPENAFANCSSLKRIEFPDTVKTIGTTAFFNSALDIIKIPASVETIGSSAFINSAITDRICYVDSTVKLTGAYIHETCKYIYLKKGIPVNTYLNENYDKVGEFDEYVLYIRKE